MPGSSFPRTEFPPMFLMAAKRLMRWSRREHPLLDLAWPHQQSLWLLQFIGCIAVSWVLASVFWWFFTPAARAGNASATSKLADQTQLAVMRHLFGSNPSKPANAAGEQPGGAAVPIFSVRLLGTYVDATQGNRAVLALAPDTGEVTVARPGDRLPSGHEVQEVHGERVILSKDGQLSEIALRKASAYPGEPASPPGMPPDAYPPPMMKDPR